ncbi:MAG: putative ATP-binding cassette transporter [Alteromonadaceae bacterium]|jgi:putative ATP-binding cassette transporter
MKLFDVLVRESANKVFGALLLGVITGICFSMLIPLVLISLETPVATATAASEGSGAIQWLGIWVSQYRIATAFLIICVGIIVFKTLSQVLMSRVSMDAAYSLRVGIYRSISNAPIESLERMGSSKLMAIITGDIPRIMNGATVIPELITSTVTLLGILFFLTFISFPAFLFIVLALTFGLLTHQIPTSIGEKYYASAREYWDSLHEGIRGVIYGAKELKLNHRKREAFYDQELLPNENNIRRFERKGFMFMQTANNYGDMFGFIIIGVVAFILSNYQTLSQADLFGVVMAMIYIISPMGSVLQCLPTIAVAKISLARLNDLNIKLEAEPFDSAIEPSKPWQSITLRDVCYTYGSDLSSHEAFHMGPVSFTLKKGEVTFIVGGNGSGKSTLSKLITQHYQPSSGTILFDDVEVDATNRNRYRQDISAIYSDYFLFSQILSSSDKELDTIVVQYLEELEIKHKVKVEDGRFSTIALSDGQKRRLALVVAMLDNCELYVFDEWAADQDPTFKAVFYHHILPKLKQQGKAILVISHDDRFFSVADQLVWMEAGQLSKIERPSDDPTQTSSTTDTLCEQDTPASLATKDNETGCI